MPQFRRKQLPHGVPNWVKDGEIYFITINCLPRGKNQLANDSIADCIFDAVRNYEESSKWHVKLFLLMPDHLHGLISFNTREHQIRTLLQSFKRYLARISSIQWQRSYFEHRIRNQDELQEKAAYIRNNPVRAGLADTPEDWKYIRSSSPTKR